MVLELREGFKKELVDFYTKRLTPLSGKKLKKTKNYLRGMKRTLYDMGLQRVIERLSHLIGYQPLGTRSSPVSPH